MSEPTSNPSVPPVPRYGEYAPGHQPPAPSGPASAGPPPAPYGSPAPAQSAPYGAPQYGAPPAGAPQYGAPPSYGIPPAPTGRRRKTWDVVLTIVFLVLGLIGMVVGLLYAAIFSSPELVDQTFRQQGLPGFSGQIGAAPAIIAISHVVLYLVALGLSILFLVKRLVAFWVPLVAGVIAAIIFWAALMTIFLSDPNFVSYYT